jgi:hypothetical protein
MARLTAIPTSPLAFILTFSLILFLLWAPNQLVSFEDSLSIATPSLTGFEVVKPGVFQAVKAPSEFHSLNTPIALIPNSYYRFRYNISQLPRVFSPTEY